MRELQVWVGDRLVAAGDARVSVFDRGFRTGEGVFETLRAYGTFPFRLDAHLERAAAGAMVLGFALPPSSRLARALRVTAAANRADSDLALRLTVTPGAVDPRSGQPTGEVTVVVTAQPIRHDPDMYRCGVSAVVVPWSRELPQVKAVSYLPATLARRQAQARGAAEALLTDQRGFVLEGSYSNVFAVSGDRLVTPPVESGILPGVTRAVTLEIAADHGVPVEEAPLPVEQLQAADEAFLTASTRELVPLVRVEGEPIGSGRPGRLTAALLEAYRLVVRREVEAARAAGH